MELRAGAVFGRYTIESDIGRGGMGRVMLATDGVLHRKVALKILLPNLLEKEEVVARFFREARLAAKLSHPNVVHIYDLGEVDAMPFIAMEYVEGKPLTAYLGDGTVPAQRRLRWLVDVAKGLAAAHARGLLHRDMKPANVMVSVEGVAKVVDFGLAKRDVTGPASLRVPSGMTFQTAQGFVVGTPAYMAPEQLEAGDVDARADQFGWALTAYALMLGRNLRKDDPLLFGPIPLLSDRVPAVPRRAAEIVLRALSNDREMRFPSMDALLAELRPTLSAPSAPDAPLPDSPATREARPAPRRTPDMGIALGVPMVKHKFCPECGVAVAMPSSGCDGPHVAAFPTRPHPASEDETMSGAEALRFSEKKTP